MNEYSFLGDRPVGAPAKDAFAPDTWGWLVREQAEIVHICRQLGMPWRRVAEFLGTTPTYVKSRAAMGAQERRLEVEEFERQFEIDKCEAVLRPPFLDYLKAISELEVRT